jgi:GT2 family glycosyltransferase/tRNA A-37 threonylcarbamoyl transferase component Bud32
MDKISIILVTLGDEDALPACLASVARGTAVPHELIVVNSAARPLPLAADPPVRLIETAGRLGYARAVARGAAAATGEYLLLLHPGVKFAGDVAGEMLDFLRSHARAGIVGAQVVRPGEAPAAAGGPVEVAAADRCCLLVRRAVFEALGGMDEGFFRYFETADLCLRAVEHGFEVWMLPNVHVTCTEAGNICPREPRHAIEFWRARQRFVRKHDGVAAAAVFWLTGVCGLAAVVVGCAAVSFLRGARERLRRSARLLGWHLAGMPAEWGLEQQRPALHFCRRDGLGWYTLGRDVPDGLANPEAFLNDPAHHVVKNSRPSHIAIGELEGEQIYLKRFNYRFLRDDLRNLVWPSRARHCLQVARQLADLGFRTPEAFLAGERRRGPFLRESYLVTRAIEAVDLARLVETRGYTDELIRKTARFVRRLHDRGVLHGDLKGRNLMLDESGAFNLIDLDRCRIVRYLGTRARAKNLSYLNATFDGTVPPEKRRLFLDEYVRGETGLERRRAWLERRVAALTAKRRTRHP